MQKIFISGFDRASRDDHFLSSDRGSNRVSEGGGGGRKVEKILFRDSIEHQEMIIFCHQTGGRIECLRAVICSSNYIRHILVV